MSPQPDPLPEPSEDELEACPRCGTNRLLPVERYHEPRMCLDCGVFEPVEAV